MRLVPKILLVSQKRNDLFVYLEHLINHACPGWLENTGLTGIPGSERKTILRKMLISPHSHPMEILGFSVVCHRLLDSVADQKVLAYLLR